MALRRPPVEHQSQRLLEVGRELVAESSVDGVLTRVLEVARELTGARYAALGVLDQNGRELERFITQGIDDAEADRVIGSLPRGHGVLGELIVRPQPLRLDEVSAHPRSYGFPPGHPPMSTFLGVPISIRGEVYGNLYLTERDGGPFTEADEQTIGVLAEWAAVAVDNARAHARANERRVELEQAVAGLEASMDISRALGGELELDRILELIVKRSRALLDARTVVILLPDELGDQLALVAMAGEGDPDLVGERIPVADSLSGRVLRTGRPLRLADVNVGLRHALTHLAARAGLFIRLLFRGQALGVLAAFDRMDGGEFSAHQERLLRAFADSAAISVATAQDVAQQGMRRGIESSERERTRWARELHDETLQELAGIKVLLSSSRGDPAAVDAALEQIDVSITGLRHLITELRPAALDQYGLGSAVEALAERVASTSGLSVVTELGLAYAAGLVETRLLPELEATVYRLVQEALTNATRHASAETVWVTLQEGEERLLVEIRDDGRGFDPEERVDGFGLAGMRERVELAGASLDISSSPGYGTTISAIFPVRRTQDLRGSSTRS